MAPGGLAALLCAILLLCQETLGRIIYVTCILAAVTRAGSRGAPEPLPIQTNHVTYAWNAYFKIYTMSTAAGPSMAMSKCPPGQVQALHMLQHRHTHENRAQNNTRP